jgi:hypothetical protein
MTPKDALPVRFFEMRRLNDDNYELEFVMTLSSGKIVRESLGASKSLFTLANRAIDAGYSLAESHDIITTIPAYQRQGQFRVAPASEDEIEAFRYHFMEQSLGSRFKLNSEAKT